MKEPKMLKKGEKITLKYMAEFLIWAEEQRLKNLKKIRELML